MEAVLAAGFDDVVDARRRLEALAEARQRPDFAALATTFKRVANITERAAAESGQGGGAEAEAAEGEEAERHLASELGRVAGAAAELRERRDYPGVLRAVAELKPAVDRLFDEVLVMAEEPALRARRLGLVRRVASLFAGVADFRRIQVDQRVEAGATA